MNRTALRRLGLIAPLALGALIAAAPAHADDASETRSVPIPTVTSAPQEPTLPDDGVGKIRVILPPPPVEIDPTILAMPPEPSATALGAPVEGNLSGEAIVETARDGIGVRYSLGGSTRDGWDCSGFTRWVYAQHGVELPRTSAQQSQIGVEVSAAEARPGDLVHWPGHVGIYAGDGMVIDAGWSPQSTTERAVWGDPTYLRIVEDAPEADEG